MIVIALVLVLPPTFRNVREAVRTEPREDLIAQAAALARAIVPDDRLGCLVREDAGGLRVAWVLPWSRAAQAGLRRGDVVRGVASAADLAALPEGSTLRVARDGRERTVRLPMRLGPGRPVTGRFHLAVVLVDFPDEPAGEGRTPREWEDLLFGAGGESLAAYYREVSGGLLDVSGTVFDWVRLAHPLAFFADVPAFLPTPDPPLFGEALAALRAREGPEALDGYDAVAFVLAGDAGTRGTILWPHSSLLIDGRVVRRYYATNAGRAGPDAIGVHCHEFGHVLGLLDKYGLAHATGVGVWCAMATGHRGASPADERHPFHLCAVCKWRLGWVDPVPVDPRVPQRLWLEPVEGSRDQVLRVLLDPYGRESFFIEYRAARGFDAHLPAPGVLIWHVGEWGQRLRNLVWTYDIDLEEAHGQDELNASDLSLPLVPFGAPGRDRFAPDTMPSSRSNRPDAPSVRIEGIRVEGDRAYLEIRGEGPSPPSPLPGGEGSH